MVDQIGKVTHYFDKAGVAVVELSAPISKGETISIQRGEDQFTQTVDSMQVEHEDIKQAKAGQTIGLKVAGKAKPGAIVLRGELPAEE